MYMMVLYENDGITLNELTESVGIDKANTTRVVKALKSKCYIYTDPAIEGTRKYKVYLTEDGKKAAEIVKASITKTLDKIFSILTETERVQYINLLKKIITNISNV